MGRQETKEMNRYWRRNIKQFRAERNLEVAKLYNDNKEIELPPDRYDCAVCGGYPCEYECYPCSTCGISVCIDCDDHHNICALKHWELMSESERDALRNKQDPSDYKPYDPGGRMPLDFLSAAERRYYAA